MLDLNFRLYLFARFLVTFAVQAQLVAVSWQVYSLTKDPIYLALIGLSEAIAAIGFAMFAGHKVDGGDAKRWKLFAAAVIAIQAFILCALAHFEASISTPIFLLGVYLSLFIWGAGRAFYRSSSFAVFGEILERKDFVRAEAMNSSAWQIGGAIGPAVGGLWYAYFGPTMTYFLSGLCFVLAFLMVLAIKRVRIRPVMISDHWKKSIFEGFQFVWNKKVILSAISLDLFAVLFGGAVALLPMFADRLGVGPEGLGWLRAAQCIGAIPVVLYLSQRPLKKYAGKILLASVALFGICWILFALSTVFWISLALIFLTGSFDAVSVVLRGAISQVYTPDNMRGRVSAINGVFISSSNEIGAVQSGLAAKILGTIPAVVFGGAVTLVVVAVIGYFSKDLRDLEFS